MGLEFWLKRVSITGWWYQDEFSHNITWENMRNSIDKSWIIWYQDELLPLEEYSYSQMQLRTKPTFHILFNLLLDRNWNAILSFFEYPVYINTPLKSYSIREKETKKKIKEYIFDQLLNLTWIESPGSLNHLICEFIY